MKKIIFYFGVISILILRSVYVFGDMSINFGGSFADKKLNSIDVSLSASITPTISITPALTLFKSSSNEYGKNLSLTASFDFNNGIFIQSGIFAQPELDNYKNSGWNIYFGKSLGEKIVFTPSIGVVHTTHSITYTIELPFMNRSEFTTTDISEFSFAPDISISFYDYTQLEFTYTKNNQTVYVRNKKVDLYDLFTKNKLAQRIIFYTPNLYNTVSNFVDKAFTISVYQYLFYFLSLNLSYTRDIYLLPVDDNNTILKDTVINLDSTINITESLITDLIISYYKDNQSNKQLSTQISVGIYF